jgi:hypothetical protein
VIELVGFACFIAGWFAYPLFHVEPDACQPALDQLAGQLQMVQSATDRTPFAIESKWETKPEVKIKHRTWTQIRTAAEAKSELEAEAK